MAEPEDAEFPTDIEEWPGLPDHERFALVELVNRVLDKGVMVTGEVTISIAGVDLVFVGLQVILSSVESLERARHIRSAGIAPHDRPPRR